MLEPRMSETELKTMCNRLLYGLLHIMDVDVADKVVDAVKPYLADAMNEVGEVSCIGSFTSESESKAIGIAFMRALGNGEN